VHIFVGWIGLRAGDDGRDRVVDAPGGGVDRCKLEAEAAGAEPKSFAMRFGPLFVDVVWKQIAGVGGEGLFVERCIRFLRESLPG